jgi:hypothetical protein
MRKYLYRVATFTSSTGDLKVTRKGKEDLGFAKSRPPDGNQHFDPHLLPTRTLSTSSVAILSQDIFAVVYMAMAIATFSFSFQQATVALVIHETRVHFSH